MPTLQQIEDFLNAWADLMWSTPLVVLLVGGGMFFMVYSRFRPYRYFGHAIALLRGKYSDPNDPGHIPHSQALATALSGTLGLGNIAGVAIAISMVDLAPYFGCGLQPLLVFRPNFIRRRWQLCTVERMRMALCRVGPCMLLQRGWVNAGIL